MAHDGYANPRALVDTAWVDAHRHDPDLRVVEVDVDTAAYATGHIPGAVGWDWQVDLQQRPARDIPTKAEWEALLGRSGIGNRTRVVLYGDNHNWFAAFAYWLFKMHGHRDVALMDGGRARWLAEGRETTTEVPSHGTVRYEAAEPDRSIRVLRDHVAQAVDQRDRSLVDVRSPKEYSGELIAPEHIPQEGAQRAGHIPGAASIPWASTVTDAGTFKPAAELRALYAGAGVTPDRPAITYCRIGERSAHSWYVLKELLGYDDVRNYDGSWTEWGSLIGAPIER